MRLIDLALVELDLPFIESSAWKHLEQPREPRVGSWELL